MIFMDNPHSQTRSCFFVEQHQCCDENRAENEPINLNLGKVQKPNLPSPYWQERLSKALNISFSHQNSYSSKKEHEAQGDDDGGQDGLSDQGTHEGPLNNGAQDSPSDAGNDKSKQ